jgi:hypothetical protein
MTGYAASPYGDYYQSALTIPWTNGSGATHSTLNFNNMQIGIDKVGGKPITVTGNITIKRWTGAILTLTK